MHELLPYLAAVAREARLAAGVTYAHVAVHVLKNGRAGVSESTLVRFEHAQHWPENPDAIVAAYATAVDCAPYELWQRAVERWQHVPGS
jgi:hypothetical protein